MKTDSQLQHDVIAELKWEPLLREAEIGVSAKDGIVTLTGTVDGYAKKAEAEEAVKRVAGVNVVVEKIEVKYGSDWGKKDDNDIAAEIVNAFKWNWEVPSGKVTARVEKGWVTLEGQVEWNFQSEAARKAVVHLTGVTGVSNNVKVKSQNEDAIEKNAIESALKRNWVHVRHGHPRRGFRSQGNAQRNGWIRSIKRTRAERIAWNAPGVWNVGNELVVEYDYD